MKISHFVQATHFPVCVKTSNRGLHTYFEYIITHEYIITVNLPGNMTGLYQLNAFCPVGRMPAVSTANFKKNLEGKHDATDA